MKKVNLFKAFSITTVILICLVIAGCHKDNVANGTLKLHLHTYINGEEAEVDSFHADQNGRPTSLTVAQFYMSNISVKKTDGSWYTIPGAYLLKRIETEDYFVGSVPAGDYTDIRFNVGLDSATNASLPSSHSTTGSDSVLSTNENFMWYGAQWQGYTFLYVTGNADISTMHDGSQIVPFSYQVGTNANLRLVTLPEQAFSIVPNQAQEIHIACEYGKILRGIDLTVTTNRSGNSFNSNNSVTTAIADSIPAIFSYE